MEDKISYAELRKGLEYYHLIRLILRSNNANSYLDVGCKDINIFDEVVGNKYYLDLNGIFPNGVDNKLIGDFLKVDTPICDIVTCMQVLEHLSDKEIPLFVNKLLKSYNRLLIVSVPYKWKDEDPKSGHLQHNLDEAQIEKWFGKKPLFLNTDLRLIAIFDK